MNDDQARADRSARASVLKRPLLARAFDYPYIAPRFAIRFSHGRAHRLVRRVEVQPAYGHHVPDGVLHIRFVGLCLPILAIGSNASPYALRRKFGARSGEIIQGPVRLAGYACVHSSHVARYGALPATIIAQRGSVLSGFLQFVPLSLLHQLDASEALGTNYERFALPMIRQSLRLHAPWLHSSGSLTLINAYCSLHGPMIAGGKPILLGPQKRVLSLARDKAGWTGSLSDFVEALTKDQALRARVTAALKS